MPCDEEEMFCYCRPIENIHVFVSGKQACLLNYQNLKKISTRENKP